MHLKYIHTNIRPQNSVLGSSVYVTCTSCLLKLKQLYEKKKKPALWQIKQDHEDTKGKCGNLSVSSQLQTLFFFFFFINLTV